MTTKKDYAREFRNIGKTIFVLWAVALLITYILTGNVFIMSIFFLGFLAGVVLWGLLYVSFRDKEKP